VQGTSSTQVNVAALNEEKGIGLTTADLMANLGSTRILVVHGRSTDRTVKIARNLGAYDVFQDRLGKVKQGKYASVEVRPDIKR